MLYEIVLFAVYSAKKLFSQIFSFGGGGVGENVQDFFRSYFQNT